MFLFSHMFPYPSTRHSYSIPADFKTSYPFRVLCCFYMLFLYVVFKFMFYFMLFARGRGFLCCTRHACRGYDRLRILGGLPPMAKQAAGLILLQNTRITFGVMDKERRAIPYLSYAYPMLISLSDSDEVPMRSR